MITWLLVEDFAPVLVREADYKVQRETRLVEGSKHLAAQAGKGGRISVVDIESVALVAVADMESTLELEMVRKVQVDSLGSLPKAMALANWPRMNQPMTGLIPKSQLTLTLRLQSV